VAATAVGSRSIGTVATLHVMGSATETGDGPIPQDQLPAQGAALRTSIDSMVTEATRLPPPKGTPAAALAASLKEYAGLAGQLADSDGTLPASWFTQLRAVDADWKQSLADLSALSGQPLSQDVPDLVYPS
jgi:hypothetical protein